MSILSTFGRAPRNSGRMKRSAFWKTTLELLRYRKQLTVAL
ncbi:MAG: hypothetical protein R3C45_04635 [Phycisphaerales bacterium]